MGILYIVATPIGNLGDMTSRSIEILKSVDLIAVEDTRQTIKLLNHFDIKTKMISYHKFNERERSKELIELLKDKDIALVSDAGTPCISDPGYLLVKEAKLHNIEVIGIPGSSAVINALAISGIDTSNFSFYGFLPVDNTKLKEELSSIHNNPINTIIIYESPKRLVKLVAILVKEFPLANISICSDMTKLFERNFWGNIKDVYNTISADKNITKGEYVIVLEKNEIIEKKTTNYSLESLIVDIMVKESCSSKEAINKLKENSKDIKKKDLYNASLNLKTILNDDRNKD